MGNVDASDPPRRLSYGSMEALPLELTSHGRGWHRQCGCPHVLVACCKNTGFLLAQAALAGCTAVLLLSAIAVSAVLLPLCGLGVLMFSLLFRVGVVAFCAKCDAALVNFVAPLDEQVQLRRVSGDPLSPLLRGSATDRLVPGLSRVSAESALVLAYLVSVKLVLAALGLLVVGAAFGIPVWLALDTLSQHRADRGAHSGRESAWEALCGWLALALVFLVACLSMDMMVGLCCATTRFFCCERMPFALQPTRRYHGVGHSRVRASALPRPNVVIIRLPPPRVTPVTASTSPRTGAITPATAGLTPAASAPSPPPAHAEAQRPCSEPTL